MFANNIFLKPVFKSNTGPIEKALEEWSKSVRGNIKVIKHELPYLVDIGLPKGEYTLDKEALITLSVSYEGNK
jgi:hypothetical protein